MNTLYFEKLSQFGRLAEPVTVSIPFAQGRLRDPHHLNIKEGDRSLPIQTHPLAKWSDGSIKWLLVHLQPDLPGNLSKTLQVDINETPRSYRPDVPASVVTVQENAEGIQVATGSLSFFVPRSGFLPIMNVALYGRALWDESPFQGFLLKVDDQLLTSSTAPVSLKIEESGPLRAVILVTGKHRSLDGQEYIDLYGRIEAYAGKSYIHIEHQFIHTEEAAELTLQGLALNFQPENTRSSKLALGQGWYRTQIEESDSAVEMALTTETMLYQSNEHFIDSYYGDFWVDWCDDQGGLTLSIHQAHQNFPKTLRVDASGITCSLYPEDAPPAPVLQGMGKTHRIQLHFHEADTPLSECSTRSLQFQLPDRPSLDRDWFRANNPWRESFFPDQLPGRLMTYLNQLHDGRPKALGMFHFGDAPDSGYTDQGRGQGENVWVNNEYDRPHCCTLFYGLTGQRRTLDSALVCARHWLDVDFCHYSPDPLVHGGLKIHTRYHVTGGVIPSHEWTEGFLDYYFLTGRREGLEAAKSVAENILRHMALPVMSQPGEAAVREGGWTLRALVGMYLGTGEERWRTEATRIVEMFLEWFEEYGALLAPYTSHTMPRVPFMISLTVNSFVRYLLINSDDALKARVEKLIVATMDDLIEHCIGPDGIFYYKELPSLQRTAPTPHVLDALTYAYRITDDEEYLKVATRQFAALVAQPIGSGDGAKYADPSGAVIAGRGGGRIFADKYTSLVLFAGAAAPLGLLDWFDYP
ncbi:hypothetical protein KFU94_50375 [Chloroflexi bacterium TSY]|nr:hypothetical protein [Chloroflexi bacterium TSY]